MELKLSDLEANIKAVERSGMKVKNISLSDDNPDHAMFFKLKDLDEKKNIVTFYFSAFGNKDSDGDIIVKGAFKKTFKEQRERIKHLKNHDTTMCIGKILELHEDDHGAYAVSQLVDTVAGKDAMVEYRNGIITEHSCGFQPVQHNYDKASSATLIKEIKLWEITSLSAWGANPRTPMIDIKSNKQLEQLMESIDKVLKNETVSDEYAMKLISFVESIVDKKVKAANADKGGAAADILSKLSF